MVKNEQDIIEPFLRHNAPLIDTMIILDNASVDDTRRILIDCAKELGNIVVSDSPSFAYTQGDRMTRLLHYCQTAFFADFIMFLDADEFVSARNRQDLLDTLQTIPPGGVGLMPWRSFVLDPYGGDLAEQTADPPRTIARRRAVETPVFSKAVLRLDGMWRPDMVVWQGLHNVVTESGAHLPEIDLPALPLLHFPVRSRDQITAKAIIGWLAYLARNPAARNVQEGTHWRDIFDRVTGQDTPLTDIELCELSMRYAQDIGHIDWPAMSVGGTPPSAYERRFSSGAYGNPLSLVAQSWERSLSQDSAEFTLKKPEQSEPSSGSSATAFDSNWHWDNLFADVAPFRFVFEKYAPGTVLDIGCGIGVYLQLARETGAVEVLGLDGIPANATVLSPGSYQMRDLSIPLNLERKFDMVICTEVAEHLAAEAGEILIDNIARHAGQIIVFSAAEPGQPGHGHINCAPIAHWLGLLAQRGWYPALSDTFGMRALATMSWFRRNLVVLRRSDPASGAQAIQALANIGQRDYVWYSQAAGIRHFPFSEALPASPFGYKKALLF
jgi:SAM-dependent methyltransferase